MQGKSLVKFLLILLVLVCIVQCSFMLPTRKAEAAADQYAERIAETAPEADRYAIKKNARMEYIDSISGEEIFSIPLLKSYTYDELKKQQLALGLDLKGGHSATLQVDLREMLDNLSGNTKDETFIAALNEADAALSNSQSDYITLFAQAFRNQGSNKDLSRFFYKKLSNDINIKSADGEVISVLRRKANETVGLTFDLLKQRIDKLGVAQPNISLDAARDLIQVELPGIESPERARNMLNASAKLEFWNTYRVTDPEISRAISQIDNVLSSKVDGIETDPSLQDAIEYDTLMIDEMDADGNPTGNQVPQITERKKDDFGSQGPFSRMISLNGAGAQYASTVVGIADKNKKNAIDDMLADPDVRALFPNNVKFLWSKSPFADYETKVPTKKYELYLIKMPSGSNKPLLEGDVVTQSDQGPDPTTGEIKVNLAMNQKGSRVWADMTTKAAQQGNREVALTLDDEVISAPRVNGPITGGRTEISGNFNIAEASDLSNMLEIGKLPASVKTIQESTVGPSLGQENINKSFISLVAGVGLLVVFLLFYYGGAGIVSIITLLANLFFIFGALASFGTVLTLPGVAGIILTIGMAVDANVIIFERVKEELRSGKSTLASISDGFKHSYSAIIDANVTTLLVAFVLFYFGLGPIKGFAVVLIIGVLCSVFTAVLVGRLIFEWWTAKGNNVSFWNGMSKNMFANMQIDWIGKRKIAYVISGTLILVGLVSMFTKGFDLGVDFKGGYSYNVQFDQSLDIDPDVIRDGLTATFGETPIVKSVDTENTFNIVTSYLINDNTEGAQEKVLNALYEGINGISGGSMSMDQFKNIDSQAGTHVISSSKVGPTIADDIKKSSIYAGVIALLLIFLYIFIRFNKWQYSLGAVAALFHDSLIVLGMFSLLYNVLPISMQIDQAFIAAILTVIGYSINDTVVVFDRIREYLGIYTEKSTDEILNLAINSTFSRTVITSLTTLLVVVILLIFGGDSIKGFALALMIGILVGTYSSIFVATPIVRDLSDELKVRKKKAEKKSSFSRAAGKV